MHIPSHNLHSVDGRLLTTHKLLMLLATKAGVELEIIKRDQRFGPRVAQK